MSNFVMWATNSCRTKGACEYYRIDIPTRGIKALYPDSEVYIDVGEPGDFEKSIEIMLQSDLVHLYKVTGPEALNRVTTLTNMSAAKVGDTLKYPPTVIFDHDDNVDFVHPFNTAYSSLGVRNYPDGRLLEPDEELQWIDDEGEKHLLWKDKVTAFGNETFDIQRNQHMMKTRHEIIRTCHGVTVTTEKLRQYMMQVVGQKNVYVFPNTIVPEDYEHYNVVRENPDQIRVLWQGSSSHLVDWYPLRAALKSVFDKYPQAKLVIFGEYFHWINDVVPPERVEYHGWVQYPAYKLKRGLLNIDINLCPLVDDPFNSCKSACKWYESTVYNEPSLVAGVEAYKEVVDGETGLTYRTPEEFSEKLGYLIENTELRKKLGTAARKWVFSNRLPQHTIPGLYEFYQDTRARMKHSITSGTDGEIRRLAGR